MKLLRCHFNKNSFSFTGSRFIYTEAPKDALKDIESLEKDKDKPLEKRELSKEKIDQAVEKARATLMAMSVSLASERQKAAGENIEQFKAREKAILAIENQLPDLERKLTADLNALKDGKDKAQKQAAEKLFSNGVVDGNAAIKDLLDKWDIPYNT